MIRMQGYSFALREVELRKKVTEVLSRGTTFHVPKGFNSRNEELDSTWVSAHGTMSRVKMSLDCCWIRIVRVRVHGMRHSKIISYVHFGTGLVVFSCWECGKQISILVPL